MKSIKKLLEDYLEQPSEDVWGKLSARLDAEMPVEVGSDRRIRTKSAWKWMAAGLAVAVVAGGVAVTAWTYRHGEQSKPADKTAAEQEHLTPSASTQTVAVVNEDFGEQHLSEPQSTSELSPKKERVVETTEMPEARQSSENPVVTKPNVKQVVIPANSTLAKQMAEDPVLKTLSPDAVDWSLPTHLSIPNLFTPNDDGVNDLFVIEGLENYSSPRLTVRDKNNKVVYRSDNYRNTWSGDNCPDGVYSYEFTFKYNDIENQAVGKVRILRS